MKITVSALLVFILVGAVLADETNLTLTVDGVTYSNVTFGTVTPSSVSIRHKSGAASIPLAKLPPELQQRFSYDAQKAAEFKQRELATSAQKKTVETLRVTYETAKHLMQYKEHLGYYAADDSAVIEDLASASKAFISTYEKGDTEETKNAKLVYGKFIDRTLLEKPVHAFEYNEVVKSDVEMPVSFGLFSNAEKFYITIGDGKLSTLVELSPRQTLAVENNLFKVLEWRKQCQDGRLETSKPVGTSGGLSLSFVSQEHGDYCYVWLDARGAWREDNLIEHATVRLDTLNLTALFLKIGHAKDLYNEREQSRKNSERLK